MTILTEEEAVCPLDGTRYRYTGVVSYGTYGCGLDGFSVSLTLMPLPIPACPACRFPLLIDRLSPSETARAREIVESPAFAAMADEPTYGQLDHLLCELGRSTPEGRAHHLLKACWQVSPSDDRYGVWARRLGEAADQASAMMQTKGRDDWLAFQTFVANVERQAGLWDEATARLDRLGEVAGGDLMARVELTRRLIMERNDRSHPGPDAS